jgi:hypothetical protein
MIPDELHNLSCRADECEDERGRHGSLFDVWEPRTSESRRASRSPRGRRDLRSAVVLMATGGIEGISSQSGTAGGSSPSGASSTDSPEEEASPHDAARSPSQRGGVREDTDRDARHAFSPAPADSWSFSDTDSLDMSATAQDQDPARRPDPTGLLLAKHELEAELAMLRGAADGLYDTIAELVQERDELQQESQALLADNVALDRDGRKLFARKSTLSRKTVVLARAKAERAQNLAALDDERALITSACKDKSAELAQLAEHRDAAAKELELVQTTLVIQQRELDQTHAKLETTRSDVVNAKQELSQLKSKAKTTRDEANAEVTSVKARVCFQACIDFVD